MRAADSTSIGNRVVVTGMAGAGKSTFSRQLAGQTDLPLVHLDLYRWQPGWVLVPHEDFLQKQHSLLGAERWIADSNDVPDDLVVERADTLIVMATPWWLCSLRAFRRGVRRPQGVTLPDGCEESFAQRARDEWGIVWRNWRNRHAVHEHDRQLAERCRGQLHVHVLKTKQHQRDFIERLDN